MAKKQAGKITKILTTDDVSPLDPKEPLTPTWYGRLFVSHPDMSEIAKRQNIQTPGEYAIKVR